MNVQVALNGLEVWAYVVELDDGYRMRLDLNDWERIRLYQGQRVSVRLSSPVLSGSGAGVCTTHTPSFWSRQNGYSG